MKHQITSLISVLFFNKKKSYAYFFSIAIPLTIFFVSSLFSFTSPSQSGKMIKTHLYNSSSNLSLLSNINFSINKTEVGGIVVQEAIVSKMEQTKGLFAKMLNMSMIDDTGNLVALILTDVENVDIGNCLNKGSFYGKEHQQSKDNYSIDLGTVIFSSHSYLVLEKTDGTSSLSRNGWIKIKSCEDGLISGEFHFEIEGEKSPIISEGKFENIAFEVD